MNFAASVALFLLKLKTTRKSTTFIVCIYSNLFYLDYDCDCPKTWVGRAPSELSAYHLQSRTLRHFKPSIQDATLPIASDIALAVLSFY